MCAISGVLVMSLPIPIIAGNFEKFHKTQAKKNKLLKRRAALVAAKVNEEKVRFKLNYLRVVNFYDVCRRGLRTSAVLAALAPCSRPHPGPGSRVQC